MQAEFLNPTTLTFIQQVGFPITINLIMFGLIVYMIKEDQRREAKNEARYAEMVNKLFETINNVANKQEKFMNDLNSELKIITSELSKFGLRMDRYTDIIDDELESRKKLFIFKTKDQIKEELRKETLDHDKPFINEEKRDK